MTTSEAKVVNRLTFVLAEQNNTGRWLAHTTGKNDVPLFGCFSGRYKFKLGDESLLTPRKQEMFN